MNEKLFEQLLEGSAPSLQDFAGFTSVIEKLPNELLWKIVNDYPNLHWTLKKVALASLREKIQKENVDNALNAITTRLAQK